MISHEGALWLVRDPVDMRKGIEGLSAVVRVALEKESLNRGCLHFQEPLRQSNEIIGVGRHRGLGLPKTPASGAFQLAHGGRYGFHAGP